MVDIRLINILPTPGVKQPQTPLSVTSQAAFTPPNLANGTILSGFIVNRDASGNPILRTESGDVVFASNFFLKIGSEVVIRIENRAGHSQAHLISVNGKPPEIGTQESAFSDEPDVLLSTPSRTAQPSGNKESTVIISSALAATDGEPSNLVSLRATVITVPPASSPSSTTSAPIPNSLLAAPTVPPPLAAPPTFTLPAGTQLHFSLQTITPASSEAAQLLAGFTPTPTYNNAGFEDKSPARYAAYTRSAGQLPLPSPASDVAITQTLQPSTSASGSAVTPPTSAPAAPNASPIPSLSVPANTSAPLVGQQITATVITSHPDGDTLLQSPLGVLRVASAPSLSVGSQVQLTITLVDEASPVAAAPAPTLFPAPLPELSQQWTSLQDILQLLQSLRDELPNNPLLIGALPLLLGNHSLTQPSPNAGQISTGLLFFLSALKGNDFKSWLGEANSEWLETRGHGDLIRKASAEFSTLARSYEAPPPGQWQSLFYPVAVEGHVHQIRFFTKRDRNHSAPSNETSEDDTRFIVEVALSHLGELQLDGFIRKRQDSTQFDLFLRSHQALSPEMQRDIAAIYRDMAELMGYKGDIIFQAVREFPIHPMEDVLARSHSNIVA